MSRVANFPEREDVHHPTHIQDIYRSLLFLAHLDGQTEQSWPKPNRIWIAGHSCGAHILSHILVDLPEVTDGLTTSEQQALPALKALISGYAFLDGIYDLPDLIEEYPDYAGFVTEAFGSPSTWPAASINRVSDLQSLPSVPLLVAHSAQDELLTTRQSKLWLEFLQKHSRSARWDEQTLQGKHDDCLQDSGLGVLLQQLMSAK